jgi:hypothetical protein
VLAKSPFKCKRQSVKVIKGIAEAYYDWMVLNYKFGKLGLIHHESEQSRSRFATEPSFWSPRQQSPEPYLFLHSEKRFPGFSKEDKSLNAETHREYILGGHLADYMRLLKEDEPGKFQPHFSGLVKEDI